MKAVFWSTERNMGTHVRCVIRIRQMSPIFLGLITCYQNHVLTQSSNTDHVWTIMKVSITNRGNCKKNRRHTAGVRKTVTVLFFILLTILFFFFFNSRQTRYTHDTIQASQTCAVSVRGLRLTGRDDIPWNGAMLHVPIQLRDMPPTSFCCTSRRRGAVTSTTKYIYNYMVIVHQLHSPNQSNDLSNPHFQPSHYYGRCRMPRITGLLHGYEA